MMKIRIYQINPDKDTDRLMFMNADHLIIKNQSHAIDIGAYDKVFEGDVPCKTLEDVYSLFNTQRVAGHIGRSLSVSDIVEVREGDTAKFYFCDSVGFKQLYVTLPKASVSTIKLQDVERMVSEQKLIVSEYGQVGGGEYASWKKQYAMYNHSGSRADKPIIYIEHIKEDVLLFEIGDITVFEINK